jgi:hypothetical protein
LFFCNRQRDKIYERIAKPGNKYSVYNNQHYQGEFILKEYLIEEIFQDKASGFYALGLVSTSRKKHPALVIRGCGNWGDLKNFPTEFLPYQDLPDVLMGADKHCQAAQRVGVIQWLNKQTNLGKKPDLVGQSLGGKIGQQLTIKVPEYIHHLVTFNSIGISTEEYQRYQAKVKIVHYINPLDLFPYVLGDKLLPGTIFQTYNPNILKPDLINQHNKIILDDPQTKLKKIKAETFYLERDVYQLLKNYSKTIQTTLAELKQSTPQKPDNQESLMIRQSFDKTSQVIQQEFQQIAAKLWQNLLKDEKNRDSDNSTQKEVINSVELIQKEIDRLSKVVHLEVSKPGKNFSSFSQTFKDNLKSLSSKLQGNLDNFRKK